jgi:methyl-accepting chemotaxis protein
VLIGRSITRPVVAMTAAMTRLAAGDKTIQVLARDRKDEIGDMTRAVEVFLGQAIENDRLAEERAREQAAKERRQIAMDNHTKDFSGSVSGVLASFMTSAATLRRSAAEVGESARQTRTSTSNTVEGSAASARDLNAVAAAAEEMAASIKEISNQVMRVTVSVQVAVERAAVTDSKVASLSETADRIGDVVRLINDVAGQTNLLALNATIEAARAGDAGRGFAVVAGEVKALAAQTAKATEQIGTQIETIRGATQEAVHAVREVGQAIREVVTMASAIAAAVEEQSAATQEISNSVQTVTAATNTASEQLSGVLAIAERTDETSAAAMAAAEEVSRTASTLQGEVTDFLSAMSRGDELERRKYERICGDGLQATLRIGNRPPLQVPVEDISRGGMGVRHNCPDPLGTDTEVGLPGGSTVRGRIARREGSLLGLAFRQDQASIEVIDGALAFVAARATKAA